MIGEPPEWALWAMIGLLAFIMFCAAAFIGPGAVRNDGAVTMQDPDILDPGAHLVGDHLRERGLEPLAM
jgi:hypothetical protein